MFFKDGRSTFSPPTPQAPVLVVPAPPSPGASHPSMLTVGHPTPSNRSAGVWTWTRPCRRARGDSADGHLHLQQLRGVSARAGRTRLSLPCVHPPSGDTVSAGDRSWETHGMRAPGCVRTTAKPGGDKCAAGESVRGGEEREPGRGGVALRDMVAQRHSAPPSVCVSSVERHFVCDFLSPRFLKRTISGELERGALRWCVLRWSSDSPRRCTGDIEEDVR